ncbi:Heavy metal-associated isoprenylated plant protein [Quillaja saponaria]|uniref:Heavy metal-associated isoprenylated plant protein n=1 Tax=Quillaja saponaria TaxID=32244 RepID=A0AAD7LUZ4_QUISA|nr:Heavy metal-associated isoprenylated plant protein [Quillaja saponaria]
MTTKKNIVIKISMNDQKSRSKAMKAVCVSGVEAVAFQGQDQIVVTGEGVDAVHLTSKLRKKFVCAELVSVGPVEQKKEEKKEEKKKEKKEEPIVQAQAQPFLCPYIGGFPHCCEMRAINQPCRDPPCSIM